MIALVRLCVRCFVGSTLAVLADPWWTQAWADARDDAVFGESAGEDPKGSASSQPATPRDGRALASDLTFGGRLELRATSDHREGEAARHAPMQQVQRGDVYLKATPTPKLQAYLRARALLEADQTRGLIDQLYLNWVVEPGVFVTAGRQHLRWGSGRIWNPTDFTALRTRDAFALFDDRLGRSMIKVHVPLEKTGANLYALLLLEGAKALGDAGAALRAEILPTDSSEIAVSLAAYPHARKSVGLDVSTALGPVDFQVEAAWHRDGTHTFYRGRLDPTSATLPEEYRDGGQTVSEIVTGLHLPVGYGADDRIDLGIEVFWNEWGYDERLLEMYAALRSQAAFLKAGRQYIGAFVQVPRPGSWNATSFMAQGVHNTSDGTSLARITTTYALQQRASIDFFVAECFGDYGELCFRAPSEFQVLAEGAAFPEDLRNLVRTLPTARTRTQVGAGVSMEF